MGRENKEIFAVYIVNLIKITFYHFEVYITIQ